MSLNPTIPAEILELWKTADDLWEKEQSESSFRCYASADYTEVYHALVKLKETTTSFLEFGSGLGVVTIMASHLGFEAYGIEAEKGLVEFAEGFAKKFAPKAQFATGSFIPAAFELNQAAGDRQARTFMNVPQAYDAWDVELAEFDLIYAYPWPTEHSFYKNILKQFARPGASYLTYDARAGIDVSTI